MSFIQDKIYDFVMDNVSGDNRAPAMKILNDAFNKYEDGDLEISELWTGIDELIDLADPDKRPELEKMLAENRGLITQYFSKGKR